MFYVIGNYWREFIHETSKNINRVQKDINDLLSVIIILVTDVHGGETVFLNGMTMNEIGKIAHFLKHSHGRCVVGAFYKILHEVSIWTITRTVLSLSLQK